MRLDCSANESNLHKGTNIKINRGIGEQLLKDQRGPVTLIPVNVRLYCFLSPNIEDSIHLVLRAECYLSWSALLQNHGKVVWVQ